VRYCGEAIVHAEHFVRLQGSFFIVLTWEVSSTALCVRKKNYKHSRPNGTHCRWNIQTVKLRVNRQFCSLRVATIWMSDMRLDLSVGLQKFRKQNIGWPGQISLTSNFELELLNCWLYVRNSRGGPSHTSLAPPSTPPFARVHNLNLLTRHNHGRVSRYGSAVRMSRFMTVESPI